MRFSHRHLLLLTIPVLLFTVSVGEDVCVEGFVMDTFCADRGRLLDSPGTDALTMPEQHSLHCLVDVQICYASGFEVLESPRSGSNVYCRVFKLDRTGNEKILKLARETGSTNLGCTTCGDTGTMERGFRAALVGTPEGSAAPRMFKVKEVFPYGYCSTQQTYQLASISDDMRLCSSRDIWIQVHGSLMLAGWGFLLPLGVTMALSGRRHDPLWYYLHMCLQIGGLVVGLAGWSIALSQFQVLEQWKPEGALYMHAILGMCVMCLGLVQPINAFLRPHKPDEGQKKSCLRLTWEIAHKTIGYVAIIAGIGTVALGAFMTRYPVGFLAGLGGSIISIVAAGVIMYCLSPKKVAVATKQLSPTAKNNPAATSFGRPDELERGGEQAVVQVEEEQQRVLEEWGREEGEELQLEEEGEMGA
uniref:Cytochrome b561 domain-containing protein n=1 Tax=Chromera velia CCMP2878 TaxID=1169474 RepID=A0A0G4HUF8_9ALVE|eukprot:Cvel_8626.t1-p1 / transcript=Cvel_8626.t1 / gene=Cvel_8626 / organism=Chromera_velia_CCMP2878 / gene_product=hypothetical protein / transcript_product=hypothetical protein / location=Cvel_scaffold480:47872-49119(-) / protein_length=416 / sequence_SO=supercontig / SO=protein_coding / is_pseudo=false